MVNKIVDPRLQLLNAVNEEIIIIQVNGIEYLSALGNDDIFLLWIDNFSANPSTPAIVLSRLTTGNKKNTDNKREKYFFNRIQIF